MIFWKWQAKGKYNKQNKTKKEINPPIKTLNFTENGYNLAILWDDIENPCK